MAEEIVFNKYKRCGAGYHWDHNSMHPKKMNALTKARYQKCIMLLEDRIGSFVGKRIVDSGCGDGVLTYELFKRGGEIYGVDLSEEAINFARQKHDSLGSSASFHVESCYETHFEDVFFDAVISSDVIEHLKDPKKLLTEIDRILKPGGIAVISTPIRVTEYPMDNEHVYEWFKEEFKSLVKNVFSKVDFEYSHPVFWHELIDHSGKCRLIVNLLSYLKNPFLNTGNWRYLSMQYAIIEKI